MEISNDFYEAEAVKIVPRRIDFCETELIKIINQDLEQAELSWAVKAYDLKIQLSSFQIFYKEKRAVITLFYSLREETIKLSFEERNYQPNDEDLYGKVSQKFTRIIKDLTDNFSKNKEISNSINKILREKKIKRVNDIESKSKTKEKPFEEQQTENASNSDCEHESEKKEPEKEKPKSLAKKIKIAVREWFFES